LGTTSSLAKTRMAPGGRIGKGKKTAIKSIGKGGGIMSSEGFQIEK